MSFQIATILRSWMHLVRGHAIPVSAAVGLLTVVGAVCDLAIPADALVLTNLGFTILAAAIHSWLILRLLCAVPDYDARRSRLRIVALIVLGIPTGLAIIAGLLLLVAPGLYLAARWSAAASVLVGEDSTIGQAMGRSWRMSRNAGASIAMCIAILTTPLALALAIGILVAEPLGLWLTLIINLLIGLQFVGQWLLGVAVFLMFWKLDELALPNDD